jgi:molecular chaperone HscB
MDPFATLGLPRRYEIDMHELETRYRELQKALHPDKHSRAGASQRRLSLHNAVQVNEAYRVLKDDLKRAEALLALHGEAGSGAVAERKVEDPEFLSEVLELREALGEAKEARDMVRVTALATDVERKQGRAQDELADAFDSLMDAHDALALEKASVLVGRLKYFRRFLDEVNVIEEEVLG